MLLQNYMLSVICELWLNRIMSHMELEYKLSLCSVPPDSILCSVSKNYKNNYFTVSSIK